MASGNITYVGNPMKLAELMALLDTFTPTFNIVTP
ncbi:MAG: alkyl sulfatase C-terminal domain-containing protein [Chloroflexota bacterium]|jgi:alkyl sulfatase BDS1-like metallo-beta-lactamase superfamily hydrolase